MNYSKTLFIIVLSLITSIALGQMVDNPRLLRRNGITISGGGPGLYGSLSYDYFIGPNVDMEVGAGPFSIFGGLKYHFGGETDKTWTPYIGGYAMYAWIFEVFSDDDNDTGLGWYLPAGIQFIGDRKFSFAIEMAILRAVGDSIYFGSVKAGFRF